MKILNYILYELYYIKFFSDRKPLGSRSNMQHIYILLHTRQNSFLLSRFLNNKVSLNLLHKFGGYVYIIAAQFQ